MVESEQISHKLFEKLLNECAKEKIQVPGFVQPEGALVCIEKYSHKILQCSANICDITGIEGSTLVGLETPPTLAEAFRFSKNQIEELFREGYVEFTLIIGNGSVINQPINFSIDPSLSPPFHSQYEYNKNLNQGSSNNNNNNNNNSRSVPIENKLLAVVSVVPSPATANVLFGELNTNNYADSIELLLVEFEPYIQYKEERKHLNIVHRTIQRLSGATDVLEACTIVTQELQKLTRFNRVMVYEFDKEWHGEILAEETNPPTPQIYLGLRFPASDIPAQARALYRINPCRILTDAYYKASPIVPQINPLTQGPLDLSFATFRAVSSVHLQYLHNINVVATLTLSVLVGEQKNLWGLIVCHHSSKAFIPYHIRKLCHIIGYNFSSRIQNLIHNSLEEKRMTMRDLVAAISNQETNIPSDHPLITLTNQVPFNYTDNLLKLFRADYGMIVVERFRKILGSVSLAEMEFLEKFEKWLNKEKKVQIFWSENLLNTHHEAVRDVDPSFQTSGFLYVPLSIDGSNYMVLFRMEIRSQVKWAGAPQKVVGIHPTTHKMTLMPRNSFQTWVEEVRGRSLEWSELEIETAQTLIIDESLKKESLVKEKEAAQEDSKLKGRFLAILSHEVRTPLNAIQGMVELTLSTTNIDNTQLGYLTIVQNSSEALLHIINDLLDMSKIESGKFTVVEETMDLDKLVIESASVYGVTFKERGIDFKTEFDPSLPRFILSDSIRLRQVLSNLLLNAQKYTLKGSVIVKIGQTEAFTAYEDITPPNQDIGREGSPKLVEMEDLLPTKDIILTLAVEDTGIGIPKDKLGQIFELFEQVDNSLTRKSGGTGLGLSICRQIVTLMGGQIWCESQIGVGSKFTVEIPVNVKKKSANDSGPENSPSSSPPFESLLRRRLSAPHIGLSLVSKQSVSPTLHEDSQSSSSSSPTNSISTSSSLLSNSNSPKLNERESLLPLGAPSFHVLIVEDNILNQKVIANMIKRFEITMEFAINGKVALDRVKNLEKPPFHLILMDVCMPEMDGITATIEIRNFEKENNLHPVAIIGLSALVMMQDKEACQKAGMNGFLEKPVKLRALENVIKPVIKKYCETLTNK